MHSGIDPHDFTRSEDPFALFDQWMEAARQNEPCDPNALALASVDADGLPDVRMVLLKGVDEGGFVFYTNLESGKARHFEENPKAAMCFHWKSVARQIRIRGSLERVSDTQADAYFASRGRGSRIGAWASRQSRPLESRAVLEQAVAGFERKFGEGDIPRPAHWSGFRLLPVSMEFWKNGEDRLHDRVRFLPDGKGSWQPTRLYP